MNPIPKPVPQAVLEQLDLRLLLEAYHAGDNRAGELLLARYSRYLAKWKRFLTLGKWDPRDGELRHFLRMLGAADPEATAQYLVRRLKAYDHDDLEQVLKLTLFECATRHGSPTAQFRYLLKRRIIGMTRDPLIYDWKKRAPLDEELDVGVRPAEIDEAWVLGITCGPGFVQLSERDRRVLQLVFWYGWTHVRVAEHLEVHLSTVERSIRRIKRVLRRER